MVSGAAGVGVGTGVDVVAVAVGDAVDVTLGVAEEVAVAVGDAVAVGVVVAAGVGLALALVVTSAVGVGPMLAVGVGVGSTTGGEPAFCGSGVARSTKSTLLSLVSWPDPAAPPGSRSTECPAAIAATGVPSSQPLVAFPQPTASMAVAAPMIRIATLPPVAARPPV
jgi:hypothetical protein